MGFYADSVGNLIIRHVDVEPLRKAIIGHVLRFDGGDDIALPELLAQAVNEYGDGYEGEFSPGLYEVSWSGTGKQMSDDEEFYSLIAKYIQSGTIDWVEDLDPDARWRIRFRDGGWKFYGGEVTTVYPDDPFDGEE